MRRCEARMAVGLAFLADGIIFIISWLLLFRPAAVFPYYVATTGKGTEPFAQNRHDKLVDKPLFVLTGGVLLNQAVAIFLLIFPMIHDALATRKKGTFTAIRPLSLSLLQIAALNSCLSGVAFALAGSMLVVWDGDKGNGAAPLLILGFVVVFASTIAGLLTLAGYNDDIGSGTSVHSDRSVNLQRLFPSATSATWRDVSGDYGTPQSRPRVCVNLDHQRCTVVERTGSGKRLPRPASRSSADSKLMPIPETKLVTQTGVVSALETKNIVSPRVSNAVLPMIAPIRPVLPAPPINSPSKNSWEDFYKELLEFYGEHGHSKVLHGSLADWLAQQRSDYQTLVHELTKPVNCQLNSNRIDLLNDLSIDWDYDEVDEWNECFSQLKAYHQTYGALGMASDQSSNSSRSGKSPFSDKLHEWIRQQQDEYQLWKAKSPTSITIERILKLQALGFVWNKCSATGRVPSEVDVDDQEETVSILV